MQGAVNNITSTLYAVNSFGEGGLQIIDDHMSSTAIKQLSNHNQTGPKKEGRWSVPKEAVL